MRNRGYSKKFLASGRALLSMLATAAVILGGLVFLPREIRAGNDFNGFPNDGTAISKVGRYYSSGYFEKTNGNATATYNRFATVTADGSRGADSYAFCLANGKKFPTYKDEGKAEGIYSMIRNIDEGMYAKLLAENHKFSHIANKNLAWDTFSRLTYIYLADPTKIVERVWGKMGTPLFDNNALAGFHQVIQMEIWRYTDGYLVSPEQNYYQYKYLSNEQKKALALVRQEMWNFAVPYDQLEYRFYKPEFKRGAGYQALGTVRFKKNDITVNKVWINLDPTDKKPDTYVRLLHDGKPYMVTNPGSTGEQKEAVQKIDSEADQAVFEGDYELNTGIWSVEEVMPDDQGGWKTWKAEGYTSGKPEKVDDRHFTITNTKQPNPKVVKVRKFWFNMGESTAVPDDVYFTLYKNGTKVETLQLGKDQNSVEFKLDNNANIKQYTIKETDVAGNPWKKDGYADPVVKKVLDGVFEVSNEKKDPSKIKVKVKKVDKDQPDKLLVGANLMIEKHPFPGKYLDADWQTTGKVDEIELPAGGYRLFEKETPLGYKCAADIYFKIDDQGNVSVSGTDPKGLYVASIDKTITMADEKDTTTGSKLTDVTLSKKAADGKELPGAKLQVVQIVSKQGQNPYSKLVAEWTSDNGVKTIELPEGEYMMVETTAPNGYEVAESITFKVDAKGKVSVRGENGSFVNQGDSTVTMIDKPKQQEEKTFSVNLSKQAVNGTAELPGAKLKVLKGYSENGQLVEEWTSGTPSNSSKKIALAPGVYTMVETTAPNGYEVAESITFKVDTNGKVSVLGKDGNFGNPGDPTVTMRDKEKTFSVNLSKKVVNGTAELPGAKLKVLKVYNENSQLVEEWTSGNSSKEIQLAPGVYTMVETTAPNGYEVAESITFKVDADGKVSIKSAEGKFVTADKAEVVMYDKPKQPGGENPQQPGTEGGKHTVTFPKGAETSDDDPQGNHTTLKIVEGEDPNGSTPVGETWKPGKEDKNIKLKPGTYTLVKVVEKDGRQDVTESVTFKVDDNGKISVKNKDGDFVEKDGNTITTKDKEKTTPQQPGGHQPGTEGGKHTVTFPKDAETSEDDPKGEHTTLKIVEGEDPKGNTTVGETWKPGKEDKNVDLKPGTYTLVKVVEKDGRQEVTESVTFRVEKDGKISVKNKDGDFVKKDGNTITTKDKEKPTPQQPGEEPSQNHGTLFPPVILQQPGSTDTPQQVEVTKKTAKPSSARAEVTPQTPQADVPKTGEATTQPILPVVLILAGLSLVGVVLRRQTKQVATKD